jgi:hypothetical protein
MQRTCKRDGTVWYCSPKESRQPKPRYGGAKDFATMNYLVASQNSDDARRVLSITNERDRWSQIRTYRTCGSIKSSQKMVSA